MAVDADYTINYVGGTLSVTQVSLTITADNKFKAYGAELPTLTASYSGFVNGDTPASLTTQPTLTTTATAASHVAGNPYPITASGAVDADYTISYVGGTLSVTPVLLTITADKKSKAYGAELPTLTASYSGFVNGDTPASLTTQPTLTTTATATSPVGAYAITVARASDPDYTMAYVAGPLTIVPTPATTTAIVASTDPSAYGQSVTFTATVTGPGGTPTGTVIFKDGSSTGHGNSRCQ